MGAGLLRKLSAVAVLALAMAGIAQARPDLERVETIIVERTNEFRREQGLPPVAPDGKLTAAARYFAQHMARTDRYGHEADGKQPAGRATGHGYDYCLVAENISYQYSSEDFATTDLALRYVEGWKKSPGHRKNMISPHAIETGVAVARSDKSGRYYAVQMLARPKSAGIEFRITSAARDTVRYEVGGERFTLSPGSTRIHQHCTPDELVLLAGNRPKATPRNRDRLVVVRDAGGLALRFDP